MLLDTWAWIEFFRGSAAGEKIRQALKGVAQTYCSVLSVAEIAAWCVREGLDQKKYLDQVRRDSIILVFDDELAEQAGLRLQEYRQKSPGIGLVDAIIHVQASSSGLPMLTGDPDFKNLPGVEFIQ